MSAIRTGTAEGGTGTTARTAAPADGIQLEPRLAGYTGYLAHLASLRAEQYTRAAFPSGRDTRDLAVLGILAEAALSQAEIGILLDVNRTVMISVIDRLEAAGLAHRERDPADRRRYALRITPDGRTALAGMQEAASRANQSLTAPLGGAGHRRLNELLRLIAPEEPGTLPESLTSQAGFLLDRASRRLRGEREKAMRRLGLEPRCVRMLVPLDSAQPCTQEHLAALLGVTSPTIIAAIDELHASGLILRGRNPADRREHQLTLTPGGEAYLGKALQAEDHAQDRLASLLGTAETTELNDLLTRIATTAHQRLPGTTAQGNAGHPRPGPAPADRNSFIRTIRGVSRPVMFPAARSA
jgi:DNA-binding MarR family transcriptional regulator